MISNNQRNQDLLDTIRNIKNSCDADFDKYLEERLNEFVFDEPSEGEKEQITDVFHKYFLIALIIAILSLSLALIALVVTNNTKNHDTYRLNKLLDLRLSTVNNFKKSSIEYLTGVHDFAQRNSNKPTTGSIENKHYPSLLEDINELHSYFYDSDSLKYLRSFNNGQKLLHEKYLNSKQKKTTELDSVYKSMNILRDSVIYEATSKIFKNKD